jgi:hypothetical protein
MEVAMAAVMVADMAVDMVIGVLDTVIFLSAFGHL